MPTDSVIDMGAGVHLSISSFAREVSSSRETVRQRLVAAGAKPSGEHGGNPVYALRDLITAWVAAPGGEIDPERLPAFQKKAYFQARLAQLHFMEECGELCLRSDVEREFVRVLKILTWFCDTLPDIFERDAGATPQQLQTMDNVLDKLRDQLHFKLFEVPPAKAAATA